MQKDTDRPKIPASQEPTKFEWFTNSCVVVLMLYVLVILWSTWYASWVGDTSAEDLRRLTDIVLSLPIVAGGALFGFKKEVRDAVAL